jgi:hypothetical protein
MLRAAARHPRYRSTTTTDRCGGRPVAAAPARIAAMASGAAAAADDG